MLSVRNLRQGSAAVYAQLACNGYKYKCQSARRGGSPPTSAPVAADMLYTFNDVDADGTLEVKMFEEGMAGGTQLGKAEVVKVHERCDGKSGSVKVRYGTVPEWSGVEVRCSEWRKLGT